MPILDDLRDTAFAVLIAISVWRADRAVERCATWEMRARWLMERRDRRDRDQHDPDVPF